MTKATHPVEQDREHARSNETPVAIIKNYFETSDLLRRGICLLNAGVFAPAAAMFQKAIDSGSAGDTAAMRLSACLVGQGRLQEAADVLGEITTGDRHAVAAAIRQAWALSGAGQPEQAIHALRDAIRRNTENAELHYQLGTILTTLDRFEEAELRFTQALNIDPTHSEAMVSLAMCFGVRGAADEAVAHLQRAQSARPQDARIGLLLAQAMQATHQQGRVVHVRATMPEDPADHPEDDVLTTLASLVVEEPDFVDAFVANPSSRYDERVYIILVRALERALEGHAGSAELHHQRARLLTRLGRSNDAIDEHEQAVAIDPTCVRALIELGKLYQQTDREADATTRLEQAVEAGGDFADVHYFLGNLYRKQGQVGRARSAYRRALLLNNRYEAASRALETLAV